MNRSRILPATLLGLFAACSSATPSTNGPSGAGSTSIASASASANASATGASGSSGATAGAASSSSGGSATGAASSGVSATGAASASASSTGGGGLTPPPPAAAAGFHTLVFNQGGEAGWDIDTFVDAGHHWYANSGGFYGADSAVTTQANGILTIQSGGMISAQRQIVDNDAGYFGYAFGDGFYAEADMALDAGCSEKGVLSAFWALPVEKEEVLSRSDDWPGQGVGYEHYVELDFMEWWSSKNYTSFYVLDWYGNYSEPTPTCPKDGGYCVCGNNGACHGVPYNGPDSVDGGYNWTDFNVYGALIVPSQANDGGTGYQAGFINNQPTPSHNSWDAYNPAIGPPPSGRQIFAVTDIEHYYLIASSKQGCPMQFKYVRVWQAP